MQIRGCLRAATSCRRFSSASRTDNKERFLLFFSQFKRGCYSRRAHEPLQAQILGRGTPFAGSKIPGSPGGHPRMSMKEKGSTREHCSSRNYPLPRAQTHTHTPVQTRLKDEAERVESSLHGQRRCDDDKDDALSPWGSLGLVIVIPREVQLVQVDSCPRLLPLAKTDSLSVRGFGGFS